ncbi:CHAT domain-containing protein [Actinoplanes sp. NPDC051411]|uniref:CHAT domain-containing protein n=1 Tax=Actinoplanes sp. NPDC051411 TaxID=3155522 RepID=UPI00343B86AB
MRPGRLPRTSYGYLPPADAQVRGWTCNNEDCGTSEEKVPRSWPHPCPECGQPADPWFTGRWGHEAQIFEYRHRAATASDPSRRRVAEDQARVWAYRDAGLRGDRAGLAEAWKAWRAAGSDWTAYEMVMLAARYRDFSPAADLVLELHPGVDTRDVENDNTRRTAARYFVAMCIDLLTQEAFLDHPRAEAVDAAMRDIATRAEDAMNPSHEKGFQQIREVRDRRRFRDRIRTTRAEQVEGLPPFGWPRPDEADAAIERAEVHDDFGPLEALISGRDDRLLRARRHVLRGELSDAVRESAGAGSAPRALATYGLLLARTDPDALDVAIGLCRAGRAAGLRRRARVTPADAALARLLLLRALSSHPGEIEEAVRLIRRRCRPWHHPGADDRRLFQEVLAARAALTGEDDGVRRQIAWRRAVDAPGSPAARVRLAMAWAEWAAATGVPEFAADAYDRLVALAAQDAATRQTATARERALLAAQEYAEEAGYWLARSGRYREAVLALETGRAVADSRDEITYPDVTDQTGDGAIVYLAAARAGGYALVIAATHDPQYVDLPTLDRDTVAGLVGRLFDPDHGVTRRARELAPMAAGRAPDAMASAMRTLWTGGLNRLVLLSARGRIVTLVPVGLLTLLPLHAAGRPPHPTEFEPDYRHLGQHSAIRYVPNARALRRSRATARELAGRPGKLLAIDAPDGPGGDHLRHVARETAEVAGRWTGDPARPIHGCTWDEFRTAAEHHTVWHLACHGDAEPAEILQSRLFFADRAVTLAELATHLKPRPHRLAVLSACRTNLVGAALPNEVVGLPSALLRIGFAGVIATSWAVDDLATTYLMTAFYQFWCGEGDDPAVALGRAQHWLRTATRSGLATLLPGPTPPGGERDCPYADPRFWAAFAYTGA